MSRPLPPWAGWLCAALLYVALACALTWPLVANLNGALLGFPNIDQGDTVMLRGVVAELLTHPGDFPVSTQVYFPVGFPVMHLVPNLMDHATGALLTALPFPLSDNLWWLLVLAANGLAAHRLGHRLGGHGAGLLLGVGWICSDALLREANVHHAPQSMSFWAPLYLDALLMALSREGRWRHGVLAGLFIGLAGLTYWYGAMFLAFASLPIAAWGLRAHSWRRLALAVGVALVVTLPMLLPELMSWDTLPLTGGESPAPVRMEGDLSAVPESMKFITQQAGDPLLPFRRTPIDRSNALSLVVLGLAAWTLWRKRREPRAWALLGVAAVGYVFALGPYLKWGEDALGPSLPFLWLGEVHPFLARLTWPQRWGLLLPLGLLPLAAMAPRAWTAAPLVLLETLLLSGNAPLFVQDLSDLEGWRALRASNGAVLELPLARPGPLAPVVGLHQRFHRRPVVNPMLLPPGADAPVAWDAWLRVMSLSEELLVAEKGRRLRDPATEAVVQLREAGVGAIAIDALPGSSMKESRRVKLQAGLTRVLGEPEDHGCALVWWVAPPLYRTWPLEDGERWRAEVQDRYEATSAPDLDTLIEPTWNRLWARPD